LREYLHECLYDQDYGFFSDVPILEGPHQRYPEFKNRSEYEKAIATMVRYRGGKFITPSELFRPWYGRALANWVLSHHDERDPLLVYEIGAGNGSTAEDFLRHLKEKVPKVYDRCTYNIIEISGAMGARQKSRLAGYIDDGKATVHECSITNWSRIEHNKCFVLALEVLDNMPHDRVVVEDDLVFQTHVAWNPMQERYEYELYPLSDELILRTGFHWQKKKGYRDPEPWWTPKNVVHSLTNALRAIHPQGRNVLYVPTTAQLFLEVLQDCFPNHRLLVSDFDFLPRASEGQNGPLLQSYYPEAIYHCITAAPLYNCDIIFPTDFSTLLHAYETISERTANIQTHRQFLTDYGYRKDTELQDGYNPMLENYANIRYLTSTPPAATGTQKLLQGENINGYEHQ